MSLTNEDREALGMEVVASGGNGVTTPLLSDAFLDLVEQIVARHVAEARAAALNEAAERIDADEDIAFNFILGGPGYAKYWLRNLAASPP